MQKTVTVTKKPYLSTKKSIKKKKYVPENKLIICSVKGTCPVPDIYRCQFHYGEHLTLSANSLNLYSAEFIYNGNSLYDPDTTGGGNQPYFYDQLVAPPSGLSGLYKSWTVSSSKIDLDFSVAGTNTVPVYVWLLPVSSDNTSLPVSPPDLDEYPRGKRLMLSTSGGSASTGTLSNFLPTYVHENITRQDWRNNEYDYQGAWGSSPQKTPYWYIVIKPADGNNNVTVYVKARMTYWAELNERNQELALS